MSDGSASRVAVIAIHGVGDHLPEEMAKAAGGMLESRQTPAGDSRYEAFRENPIRVKTGGVKLRPEHSGAWHGKRAWGPLDELRMSGTPAAAAAVAQKDSIDHLFMEGQLSGYEGQGPEDTCEFLRLEGVRKAQPGIAEKLVHVHDMFWSDLSGVGQKGLRVFGELYQLLFHLGSVGVNNVAAAAAFFRSSKKGVAEKWDAFAEAQKFAANMLAFYIPFLNLVILAFAVTLFATVGIARLQPSEQWIAALIAVATVIAGVWAYLLMRGGKFSGASFRAPLLFAMLTSLAGGITIAIEPSLKSRPHGIPQAALAALVLGLALIGESAMVAAYEKRRPGATVAFRWTLAVVAVSSVISLYWTPWFAHFKLMAVILRADEVGFWWLTIAWFFFWIGMLWALLSGRAAVKAVRSFVPEEAERAARTNWTARLTIGLPATVFLLVTFAAWSGLLNATLPMLPRSFALDPSTFARSRRTPPSVEEVELHCRIADTLCYEPLLGRTAALEPAKTWADDAFYDAGIGFLPVLLLLTGIAAVIAIYAVAPSVVDEVSPPFGADAGKARALGDWLDQGFRFMRLSGRCLYVGVFLFPIALGVVAIAVRLHAGWVNEYMAATAPVAETLGALVGGAAAGVLAFGGRLSKLALGLRTGVRVGLDVDNWLREHPHGTNPTARICARYVSLLRQIAQWRNEHDEGYDALVIFAHSQGTIITSDLLRFLHVEATSAAGGFETYDPSLARLAEMKIYVFTVGCPLRQLYGLRFPFIYGIEPAPADLGVTAWTNAYRTGDYIGRYLWRPDDPWNPGDVFVDGNRTEFAIGPGAHTHYWDKTGDAVAEALDAIIARA